MTNVWAVVAGAEQQEAVSALALQSAHTEGSSCAALCNTF